MRQENEDVRPLYSTVKTVLLVLTSMKSILIICSRVVRNLNSTPPRAGVLKQVDV